MFSSRPRRARLAGRLAVPLCLALLAGCVGDTRAYYAQTLDDYLERGLLRDETAPDDAPFDDADLIRSFRRLAFRVEFTPGETLDATSAAVPLLKWRGPVRWKLMGDRVRAEDGPALRAYLARLSELTGLDFVETARRQPADIHVMIAGPQMRARFAQTLETTPTGARLPLMRRWSRDERWPCVSALFVHRTAEGPRRSATVAIRGETRGLQRQACFEEELAQVLGLLNDDDEARPSIFNDDQEFALLTEHDEYLLRILYDPRLRAGMSAKEGMPIVRRIVAEIGPDRQEAAQAASEAGRSAGRGADQAADRGAPLGATPTDAAAAR